MSAPLQPLGDYLVAQTEEPKSKTASGLYLPDSAKEKPVPVKVIAIGKDTKQIKVGDRIIYRDFEASKFKIESEEYILVKEKDVMATVK